MAEKDTDPRGGVVWGLAGFTAGAGLVLKVVNAMGIQEGDDLTATQILIMIVLLIAPIWVLMTIAERLSAEVTAGKSTEATYWTTMTGLSVTALALVGITSIDDLLALTG
ncbi:hypothetical protein ACF1BN_37135 [Streptomyces sp. NPDC014861]|uniref:hypothetical protein n=1 Tax=Streptomyces sp. NPDC014861 TaxID=3364923 RepID=UPI0036FDADE3